MIITLTGNNDFARLAEQRQLIAAFVAAEGDLGLEQLDGAETDIARLQEALSSPPFLSSRKLVVLQRPSQNTSFLEQHAALLTDTPDTTDVLIIEPTLDKRLSYYKYLQNHSDFRAFPALDGAGLARWAVTYAAAAGGRLSSADAQYLINRVGLSQQQLSQELDKLLLHNPLISRQSIELLTDNQPQSTIFELLDVALAGRQAQALHLYREQQALGVEPQQLIAMLAWQLHVLALIKSGAQRTPDQIASQAKISPYVVRKSMAAADRLTTAQLKQQVAALATLDGRAKTEPLDLHAALQHFILTLA